MSSVINFELSSRFNLEVNSKCTVHLEKKPLYTKKPHLTIWELRIKYNDETFKRLFWIQYSFLFIRNLVLKFIRRSFMTTQRVEALGVKLRVY